MGFTNFSIHFQQNLTSFLSSYDIFDVLNMFQKFYHVTLLQCVILLSWVVATVISLKFSLTNNFIKQPTTKVTLVVVPYYGTLGQDPTPISLTCNLSYLPGNCPEMSSSYTKTNKIFIRGSLIFSRNLGKGCTKFRVQIQLQRAMLRNS